MKCNGAAGIAKNTVGGHILEPRVRMFVPYFVGGNGGGCRTFIRLRARGLFLYMWVISTCWLCDCCSKQRLFPNEASQIGRSVIDVQCTRCGTN